MAKVSLILDPRVRKDGTSTVMLSFIHKRYRRQVSLGLSVKVSDWQPESSTVEAGSPKSRQINQQLNYFKSAADVVLLRHFGTDNDGKSIFEDLEATLFPKKVEEREKAIEQEEQEVTEAATLISVSEKLAAMKKPSTRATYERTIKHLGIFVGRGYSDCFDEINKGWLAAFDVYLTESNPSPNARALHMRNLRAIINYAIDEGITTNYAFRRHSIKTVKTAKRNLSVEELREVFNYDVEDWQVPYRDMFKLSFLLIGMNFADMLNLSKSDMRSGRIEFNRHKTSRLYSMKVEPEALELIQKYAGKEYLLSIMESRKDYVQYIRQTNHALKCIGTKSVKGRAPQGDALFPEITTYWARHTWATIARSIGVSVDDIALALGHGDGHDLTHIYIEDDLRKVDEANRKVLDWVLYGKKDGVIVDQAFKPKKETEKKKSGGTKKSTTPEIKAEEAA